MPYEYARAYMNDAAWVDFESRADTLNQPAPDSAATTDP